MFVEASSIEIVNPLNSAFAAAAPLPSHIAQLLLPQHLALRHFAGCTRPPFSCVTNQLNSCREKREAGISPSGDVAATVASSLNGDTGAAAGSAVTVSELFDGLWGVVRTPQFAATPNGSRFAALRRQLIKETCDTSEEGVLDEWAVREAIVNGSCPQLTGIPIAVLSVLLAMLGACCCLLLVPLLEARCCSVEGLLLFISATRAAARGICRMLRFVVSLLGGCDVPTARGEDPREGGIKRSRWGRYEQQTPSARNPDTTGDAATAEGDISTSSNNNTNSDAGLQRHSVHLLLLGDASTGKSQLLRAAARLSTHAVSASGALNHRREEEERKGHPGLCCFCVKSAGSMGSTTAIDTDAG